MLESLAARLRTFGFLALAGAAYLAGGDIWRASNQQTAQARVVAVSHSCWLIGADGRVRGQQMACADAERAKAARPGEALRVSRGGSSATLEFKTASGQAVRIEPSTTAFGLSRAKAGDVVTLAYDPAKPTSVRTPARLDNLSNAKWVGIAGIVLLWLGGVLRKAGGAAKGGLADLAAQLRKSAEEISAQTRSSGKGGFAAMDRLATASAGASAWDAKAATASKPAPGAKSPSEGKPAPARHSAPARGKTPSRAPAKPLPKGTPRVVSPRRRGLLGLFR